MPYSSASPDAFLALGIQSALGTAQVTPAKLRFAKYLSGNTFDESADVVDLREGGDGLEYGSSYLKTRKVTGQLVLNARPEIAGLVLPAGFGGASWDGASLPAAHTLFAGASFPWYTILAQHPGSAIPHLISDVRFSGLTIEAAAGEPLKLTLPFVGLNSGASLGTFTPTYHETARKPGYWLYTDQPTYSIASAADTDITAWKLSIELGVEELQAQAVTLDEAVVQNRSIDLEVTRRFEDPTLWKQVYMGGGVAPVNTIGESVFQAGVRYGAGGSLAELTLNVPQWSLRESKLGELNPDGQTVMETLTGRALKGATHPIWATLKNNHASVYGA